MATRSTDGSRWSANTSFTRESGAVASQFHVPEAIEPYPADFVGANRKIVLGKKSGLASIDLKAKELGLEIAEPKRADVLADVKDLSVKHSRLVTDDEFREIVQRHSVGAATGAD